MISGSLLPLAAVGALAWMQGLQSRACHVWSTPVKIGEGRQARPQDFSSLHSPLTHDLTHGEKHGAHSNPTSQQTHTSSPLTGISRHHAHMTSSPKFLPPSPGFWFPIQLPSSSHFSHFCSTKRLVFASPSIFAVRLPSSTPFHGPCLPFCFVLPAGNFALFPKADDSPRFQLLRSRKSLKPSFFRFLKIDPPLFYAVSHRLQSLPSLR